MQSVIHQMWNTKELNDDQIKWSNSVKKFHPNYEYKLWTRNDNDDFIKSKFPEFLPFYNTLVTIERCDFIRPLYIFECGGVYLDLDVIMHKPLDDLLVGADVFLCGRVNENIRHNVAPLALDTFFFAGNKGHPFFYNLCKSMSSETIFKVLSQNFNNNDEITRYIYRTGPMMLTKYYLLNKQKYDIKVFGELDDLSNYGTHLRTKTWFDRKNDKFNVL